MSDPTTAPGVFAKVHELAKHANDMDLKRRKIPATKTAQGKTFGGYVAWATNDIATALRPKMAELGLWLTTSTAVDSTGNGYLVTAEATWVDLTDGSRMSAGSHVADSSHQIGPAAGATVAVREILVKGFQLGDSADFDHDPARHTDPPAEKQAVVKSAEARAEQIAAKAKANPKTTLKAVQRNIADAAGIDIDALTDDTKATLNRIWNQSGCANGGWKDAAKVRYAMEMAKEGEPF